MSTVTRPSGPHSSHVYWVRRALLLVILALAIWGVLRWAGGDQPAKDRGTASVQGEAPSDPTPAPPTTRATSGTPRPQPATPGVHTVPARFVSPDQECEPSTLRVVPAVVGLARAGETVRIHLRLSSTVESACTVSLDADALLVAVSSGDKTVWSSSRCTQAVPTRSLAVQPHWSTVFDVVWSGQLSRRGCDLTAPFAAQGFYTVQAAMLEGEPGTADFELDAPAQPQDPRKQDNDEPKRPNEPKKDKDGDKDKPAA